jgi:hypothetical protein
VKIIRKRLTYANVMSSIAVFLVLGGGAAFAAKQLSKKSVGAPQLKANAVTTAKIKKNAVTKKKIAKNAVDASKVKSDSLTGNQINESTLGTVPSAATATTAGTINGLVRKGITRATPTVGASEEAALAAAPKIPLLTTGSISVYAKCVEYGAVTTKGLVFIESSINGALFDSEENEADGSPDFLNPGTAEDDRQMAYESTAANTASVLGFEETYYSALAPDGTAVGGEFFIGAKNGELAGGNGIYGAGSACLFAGSALTWSA